MGRVLLGGVVVAIIAAIALLIWSNRYSAQVDAQKQQIEALNRQVAQLADDNTRLKGELAKVQSEEANLAAQNEDLRKAIAAVKATGKLPPNLPYPPK
jgi:cell division protein FtsB